MVALPHVYNVHISGSKHDAVETRADNKPLIMCAPPVQYGGPGNLWSPEELFLAAIANCFLLTFRGVARTSHLDWQSLDCSVRGTLDKVENINYFTHIVISATLKLPSGSLSKYVERLLHKGEEACLITNSIKSKIVLETNIIETRQ